MKPQSNSYPYEPEGESVDRVELAAVEDAAFQNPEERGLWTRLVSIQRAGEYITSHLRFADKIGDSLDVGEVAIEVETGEAGVLEEGNKLIFREIIPNNKGKIIVGAVLTTAIVGAGSLRAVLKSRNDTQ